MTYNLIALYVNLGENMDLVKDYDNGTLYMYDQSAFKEPDSIFMFIQDTLTSVGPMLNG